MCLVVVLTKPYYASWSLLMNVGALCWHDMLASGLNCTLTQWFWNTSSIPMHFITLWKIQPCFHKRCNACAVYVCIILFVFEIYVADFTTKWFARLSFNMLMHRLGPHSALQQIVICRASVTNVTTICFLAENCVFAAYSEWYASGKNIVWQLFQAIQSIQIAVEFTSGKTRCVLKSVVHLSLTVVVCGGSGPFLRPSSGPGIGSAPTRKASFGFTWKAANALEAAGLVSLDH